MRTGVSVFTERPSCGRVSSLRDSVRVASVEAALFFPPCLRCVFEIWFYIVRGLEVFFKTRFFCILIHMFLL